MYKMCKTEQSAQRQRQLEQGLLKAMSSHHFDEISVSDLCEQIGIPRKSFYRYFSGKDGALHALIDHTLLEYDAFSARRLEKNIPVDLQELESFFLFWRSQKPLLDALARSGLSGVLIERSIDQSLAEIGTPRQQWNQNPPDLRAHAMMFIVCGIMSMVITWHGDNFFQDHRHMAQVALKLVTEPLFESQQP